MYALLWIMYEYKMNDQGHGAQPNSQFVCTKSGPESQLHVPQCLRESGETKAPSLISAKLAEWGTVLNIWDTLRRTPVITVSLDLRILMLQGS